MARKQEQRWIHQAVRQTYGLCRKNTETEGKRGGAVDLAAAASAAAAVDSTVAGALLLVGMERIGRKT